MQDTFYVVLLHSYLAINLCIPKHPYKWNIILFNPLYSCLTHWYWHLVKTLLSITIPHILVLFNPLFWSMVFPNTSTYISTYSLYTNLTVLIHSCIHWPGSTSIFVTIPTPLLFGTWHIVSDILHHPHLLVDVRHYIFNISLLLFHHLISHTNITCSFDTIHYPSNVLLLLPYQSWFLWLHHLQKTLYHIDCLEKTSCRYI